MANLNDPVEKEIVAARVKLLFDKPFFGQLAARMVVIDASAWCKTAATDGHHFYYNREFIKSLTKPQLLFLMGHEVLHMVYDHLGRRGGRNPEIWNMATDYIINWTLKDQKVGEMPPVGLYNDKYTDELYAEQLYEMLKKDSVTIKMPLDEHLELGNDDDGDGDGNGQGDQNGSGKTVDVTVMGKDGPPKLTEADLQKIRNEIKANIIQAVQSCKAGDVPAGILRMVQELIEPKLDWRALLDSHIRSSVKDDYTFGRIGRRSWGSGFILPAQDYMDTIDIFVWIDTSGSMGETMLRDILSEVKGIMLTFRDFKLQVACFDSVAYDHTEFTPANIDEIDTYQLKGGGGTTFESMFEYMMREGIEPVRMVCFTDGYPNGTWGYEGYCDVLWVIHGNNQIVAPWGITAYYEPKNIG